MNTTFRKAVRSLALSSLICAGSTLPLAASQAHHEYVPPNPQRYQHQPAQHQEDYSEPVGGATTTDPGSTQPTTTRNTAEMTSLELTTTEVLDFLHQHMIATFICMVMLAPLWAMFGMRKSSHPYDH